MATNETINQLPAAATIDPVNDLLPIFQNSSTSTLAISRNTLLGLASAPAGLTDTQTLTNKTLTAPAINNPVLGGTITGTYVIGGTPTFPSSVVQLTTTQTLTNKTLTSPTINAPTITQASITADTISGFTTSNSGTIYGVSVTSGVIASAALAGSVNAAAIASNAVLSAKLGLSSGFTGGVASQANGGTAGGTMYYINLGGLKILWGISAGQSLTSAASSSYTWTFPTSFFSTIQIFNVGLASSGTTNAGVYTGGTATAVTGTSLVSNETGGTNTITHQVWVIGT